MRSLDVPCAGCGKPVDTLRAGHVAIFDGLFCYYCDLSCRLRAGARSPSRRRDHERSPQPNVTDQPPAQASPRPADALSVTPSPVSPTTAFQVTPTSASALPPAAELPLEDVHQDAHDDDAPRDDGAGDADTLLLFTAASAGLLSLGLSLVGASPIVTTARAVVAVVGALSLAGRAATNPRDPADLHPALALATPLVSSAFALAARLLREPIAGDATTIAGVIVAVSAIQAALRKWAFSEVDAELRWMATALALPGRRIGRDDDTIVASHELRPGEALRVEPGEIVPADMVVERGQASVLAWLGDTTPVPRRDGDVVVAGARVERGFLEGIASWTGHDRAWARLSLDPARRLDVHAMLARIGRFIAAQGGVGAAALGGFTAFVAGQKSPEIVVASLAAHAALATSLVSSIAGLHAQRGALLASRRGIAYRTPEAFDAAGKASSVVFLARGTLLLGEPEVVEIEPTSGFDAARVLSLVAGAEAGLGHPIAAAVARATRLRGLAPDAVRSPHAMPGLGIRAVTSHGEPLLVGSRALMLEERVSVALAEGRIAELEGLGRTVLLVAVAGRFAGLLSLQDGLRPGARASVQHLLDVEVEPVLLSGDARETCETIARALDIEHIRPEVLPAERAGEVRRIAEAGARVAVIGRPSTDAAVLGAADVAVALGAAGGTSGDWAVSLVGDDVRDAALSLAIAHRTRAEARLGLALAVVPGVVGVLSVVFNVLPPLFAPLSGLLGALVATVHARSLAAARGEAPATPWDLAPPRRSDG